MLRIFSKISVFQKKCSLFMQSLCFSPISPSPLNTPLSRRLLIMVRGEVKSGTSQCYVTCRKNYLYLLKRLRLWNFLLMYKKYNIILYGRLKHNCTPTCSTKKLILTIKSLWCLWFFALSCSHTQWNQWKVCNSQKNTLVCFIK